MTAASPDQLAEVLDTTEGLVAAVSKEQWTAVTPCSEWNVRDLVNNLVAGNRLFAAILSGAPAPPPELRGRPQIVDHLGDEPVEAYREAADAVVSAFRQPGVLDGVFTVPFGTVPGTVALHLRITEVMIHGWDLARATGQAVGFPEDLVRQEMEFTRGALADIPPNRHPFAPPQHVDDDAPAIDRFAALLGRPVPAPTAPA